MTFHKIIPLILSLALSVLRAEEIVVYREELHLKSFFLEEEDKPIGDLIVGEKLGMIETGERTLEEIIKIQNAEGDSWVYEPFYGPAHAYIFEDSKGRFYSVHFEFEQGHKSFSGNRFAIIKLEKSLEYDDAWVGNCYEGESLSDQKICEALKKLAIANPLVERKKELEIERTKLGEVSQVLKARNVDKKYTEVLEKYLGENYQFMEVNQLVLGSQTVINVHRYNTQKWTFERTGEEFEDKIGKRSVYGEVKGEWVLLREYKSSP